jgi:hypothetical protein
VDRKFLVDRSMEAEIDGFGSVRWIAFLWTMIVSVYQSYISVTIIEIMFT